MFLLSSILLFLIVSNFLLLYRLIVGPTLMDSVLVANIFLGNVLFFLVLSVLGNYDIDFVLNLMLAFIFCSFVSVVFVILLCKGKHNQDMLTDIIDDE